jgi:HD-GYP domain-containing protein (c-di-GMP phosphodiesterase class II)
LKLVHSLFQLEVPASPFPGWLDPSREGFPAIALKRYVRQDDLQLVTTAASPTLRSEASVAGEHAPIEAQRARQRSPLPRADLLLAIVLGGGFLAVAAPLALFLPSDRSPSALVGLGLIAAYAAAFRLDFEVGAGFAIPTELMLVPMLFILPLGLVPVCVAGAILLARVIDGARRALHVERTLLGLADAWHVVGPVAVLAAAGETAPRLSHWPLYVAALAAQFLVDFAAAAVRGRVALGIGPHAQLRSFMPVWTMDAALAPIGLAVAIAATETSFAFTLALPLVGLLSLFAREHRTQIDRTLELSHAYRGTAYLLGDVIEADDAYTGSHSRDVVELTIQVAQQLQLDANELRQAEFVALLHDVGKVKVPNEIINKPGPLTLEERGIINAHTIEGEKMLERVGGLLGEVGRLVRSCHEHYDGSGYPDGLAGAEIPRVARIVCCCDAFHAMTSDRPYRKALSHDVALAELQTNSGTQFDPEVVAALIAVVRG